MNSRRWSVASCLLTSCLLTLACVVSAAPLPTRDQNPLLAGFGLPRSMPSRADAAWQLSADFNWANSAIIQERAAERLVVDAETRDLRLTLDGKLADRWLFSISAPWRSTSAGSLDGFIDDWHDFFDLPTGDRPYLSTDALRVTYADGRTRFFDRRDSMSGVGDVDVAAGVQLLNSVTTAATAWMDVKVPTGNSRELNSSGAVDVSLIVAADHRFGDRWSVFGQAGMTYLGDGDLLRQKQREWVGSLMGGVTRRLWQSLELTAQVDAHTAAFDSRLVYLSDTVILSACGAWQFGNGLKLSLGLSEDVWVEASPDVVFIFGAQWAR